MVLMFSLGSVLRNQPFLVVQRVPVVVPGTTRRWWAACKASASPSVSPAPLSVLMGKEWGLG